LCLVEIAETIAFENQVDAGNTTRMISSVIRRRVISSARKSAPATRTAAGATDAGASLIREVVASGANHPLFFSTKYSSAAPKSAAKKAPPKAAAPPPPPPPPAPPAPAAKTASAGPPPPPPTTLASRLAALAEDLPHMDVVKYTHKNQTWSVLHVHYYSEALAVGLLENGFQTGDVVLSYLPSHLSEQVRAAVSCGVLLSKSGCVS
jgi:hypothetical protein